jgi:hypothetical protein
MNAEGTHANEPANWLEAEYEQAAWDAGPRTVRLLSSLGVPADVLYGRAVEFCTFGVARIGTYRRGFYDPSEGGQIAIVQPCASCPEPYFPEVIDLCAWFPSNPNKWWMRTGCAPVLALDALERAAFFDKPLTIHKTPLDYLRSGCVGTVILRDSAFWLGGARRFLVPDNETASSIAQCFKSELPEIRVRAEELQHVA